LDRVGIGSPRISLEFNVAKSVESEMGLVDLTSLSAERIRVGGFCGPQIFSVELSIWLENFSEAQSHFLALAACHLQLCPSHHVLAQIEDVGAGGRIGDGFGLECLSHSHRLKILRHHGRFWRGNYPGVAPTGVGERSLVPSRLFEASIVTFAVIDVGTD